MSCETLLAEIANFYLKSHNYNGISARSLIKQYGETEVQHLLAQLIRDECVSVVFGDYHPNPHIKALPSEPIDFDLSRLHRNPALHGN